MRIDGGQTQAVWSKPYLAYLEVYAKSCDQLS
jgi:hypothetical protein